MSSMDTVLQSWLKDIATAKSHLQKVVLRYEPARMTMVNGSSSPAEA